LKTLPINQLKPGMFVQSVTKQTGKIRIKNQGKNTGKHRQADQGWHIRNSYRPKQNTDFRQ